MKKAIALTLAVSTFPLGGCSTGRQHSIKWEYREVTNIDEVNRLAEEGWQVDHYTRWDSESQGFSAHIDWFLLKRPKQSSSVRPDTAMEQPALALSVPLHGQRHSPPVAQLVRCIHA